MRSGSNISATYFGAVIFYGVINIREICTASVGILSADGKTAKRASGIMETVNELLDVKICIEVNREGTPATYVC
jgi:hypothetical protein